MSRLGVASCLTFVHHIINHIIHAAICQRVNSVLSNTDFVSGSSGETIVGFNMIVAADVFVYIGNL